METDLGAIGRTETGGTSVASARAVVGRTLDLYAGHFVSLLVLANVVAIPVYALTWPLPNVIGSIVNQLASSLTWGALSIAFARLDRGGTAGVRESLVAARGRLGRLFVIGFVLSAIVFIALLPFLFLGLEVSPAFAVPGVALAALLGTRWGLAIPASMLEGHGVNDSFRRSASLATPRWRTAVPVTILAGCFAAAPIAWGAGASAVHASAAEMLVAFIAPAVVLGPIGPGLLTVLFLDLRAERASAEMIATSIPEVDGVRAGGDLNAHEAIESDHGVPNGAEIAARPSRSRRLALGAAATAIVIGGVVFALGGATLPTLNHRGQVLFRTGAGQGICDITASGDRFPAGTSLYWSAFLDRTAKAGDTVRVLFLENGLVLDSSSHVVNADTDCLGSSQATGPYTTGSYEIRVLDRDEVIATGSVAIR